MKTQINRTSQPNAASFARAQGTVLPQQPGGRDVSSTEFLNHVRASGGSAGEARDLLKVIDRDNSNILNQAEFYKAQTASKNITFVDYGEIQKFLNDNRGITLEKFLAYAQTKGIDTIEAEELFSLIDPNGSGGVREAEFNGRSALLNKWGATISSFLGAGDANSDSQASQNNTTASATLTFPVPTGAPSINAAAQSAQNDTATGETLASVPSQTQSFLTQKLELFRVTDDDHNQVNEILEGPFVLAMDQSDEKSSSSPEVVDARDNFRSFTTHDGFVVATKYQKLDGDVSTDTNPKGANYAIIKFSSGGGDSTETPNLKRLGLDPANEGVTYRIVGRDLSARSGEDGYDGVYGSRDSAQLVIEIINPNAPFSFGVTGYSEGSVTFLKTDAKVEVLGGNYVDDRSDEQYVPYNSEASLTIYHEDQGTLIRRLQKLATLNLYGAYLGDDGAGNWIDNVIAFINPKELEHLSEGKRLHGNGSYEHIRLS